MRRRPFSYAPKHDWKSAIIGGVIVVLLISVAIFAWYVRGFRWQLLRVDGVTEIVDYLNYEGKRFATVRLANGGTIKFSNLRMQQFKDADAIYVDRIGDVSIVCRYGELSLSTNNFIPIASQLSKEVGAPIEIENVQQIVDNYDQLVILIDSLPDAGSTGMAFPALSNTYGDAYCRKGYPLDGETKP